MVSCDQQGPNKVQKDDYTVCFNYANAHLKNGRFHQVIGAHLLLFHFLDRFISFGLTGSLLEPITAGALQKSPPARVVSSLQCPM